MIKYTNINSTSLNIPEDVVQYLHYIQSRKDAMQFEVPEDFIFHPEHLTELPKVEEMTTRIKGLGYDFIIFVGIGGANLGVMTIYHALKHDREILFFENIDPDKNFETITNIRERYSKGQRAIMITASKSGSTTETMSNFAYVFSVFKELETDWATRTIATTTKNSYLDNIASNFNVETLHTPEELVDRYSVFGTGSLLALALVGININLLVDGLKESNTRLTTTNISTNHALNMALLLYYSWEDGIQIHNTFIFSEKLATYGRWQRQLMAESVGKDSKGITPLVSIGTTDLHSMTQLYLDGPRNISTNFITVENFSNDISCDPMGILQDTPLKNVKGKKFSELITLVSNAVKSAYSKQNLPFVETIMPTLDEYTVADLLQTTMITIILLGKLMRVNPFNQEAVELYKKEITTLLQ